MALPSLDGRGLLTVAVAATLALSGGALARQYIARWVDRDASIAMYEAQLLRLKALLANADAIRDARTAQESRHAAMPRLFVARSAAAAGAEVQTLVQQEAQAAGVSVESLDIAGDADTVGRLSVVPVTVTAFGDIYGVTTWLYALQHGSRLLDIRELTVAPNAARRGAPLQVTMVLRAPFVRTP